MEKTNLEYLKNQLRIKNESIASLQFQVSSSSDRIADRLQKIEELNKKCDRGKLVKLETRVKELKAEIEKRKLYFSETLQKQNEHVAELRKEIEDLSSQEEVVADNLEVDKIPSEVDVKRKVLTNLYKQEQELSNNVQELRNNLKQISEKNDVLKLELFEAHELESALEMEKSSLLNAIQYQEPSQKSLFDEVNDSRKIYLEKMELLKKKLHHLENEKNLKRRQLVRMLYLIAEMKEHIKNHPVECQADFDQFLSTFIKYVEKKKDLFHRYNMHVAKLNEVITKGLPEDVAKYCTELIQQQRNYQEELRYIAGGEYRVLKDKSINLREINFQIREANTEKERLLNKIKNDEEKRRKTYREVQAPVSTEDGEKLSVCSEVDNVKRRDKVKEERKVNFDENVKDNNARPVRRGGKVLEYKSVFFPSKKKNK